MSLQEELLKNYTSLLESTGQIIGEDGKVYTEGVGDTLIPIVVANDEVLTLPTPTLLRSGAWDGLQPFHPLSENALRGESVILKKLRILTASRLVTVLSSTVEMLTHVAADTSLHAKLSPKASEFLDFAKKADEKTLKRLKTVIDKVTLSGDHRLLAFFFGRPGTAKKESFTRFCRVDFPIFDELNSKEPTIFGVKMRHDDKATIKGIFKWLLDASLENDNIDTNELFDKYGTGTHSLTAPYFYTLMSSYAKVAKQLNSKLKLFKKSHPEQVKELTIDLGWEDFLENLSKYRDIIPALKGNEGAVATHPGRRAEAAPETAELPAAPAVRQKIGFDTPVGSAGVEKAPSVPKPAEVVSQPTVQVPTQAPSTVQQAPALAPAGERLVSWSSVNQDNHSPHGLAANGLPMYYQSQPTLLNPNGRDALRAQNYQRYQQSPHSQYDVRAASVPVAPIGQRYATTPVSPQFRTVAPSAPQPPTLPKRW